jgi:hypothetical protein
MKTIIFQSSPHHTGSTVLINILHGLIPKLKDKPVIFDFNNMYTSGNDFLDLNDKFIDNLLIIKTHNTDIDEIMSKYSDKYKLIFICSVRKDENQLIDKKYKDYKNVIVFSFNSLNESENNTIEDIVNRVYKKIKKLLNINFNIKDGINRIVSMNNLYEKIKDKNFDYYDTFYHIHGSHRNRYLQQM